MSNLERRPAGGSPQNGGKSFRLDKADAKIWGVCGGIANYLGVDATMVRIGAVVVTLIGVGLLIPIYVAIALIAD